MIMPSADACPFPISLPRVQKKVLKGETADKIIGTDRQEFCHVNFLFNKFVKSKRKITVNNSKIIHTNYIS